MEPGNSLTPSPSIKFEDSPTESLLSTPDEMYPSLFGANPTPATAVNFEMLTPKSFVEEKQSDATVLSGLTALAQATIAQTTTALTQPSVSPSANSTPEPEKKPVKKRKSWGQVLPQPKTNLPPRKRAKTEDEKEQRRVERVLRNRRAAQSSRERKRLEVENLERRNKELEAALLQAHQTNLALLEEIQKLGRSSGVVTRTPSSLEGLRQSPITFSQQLFGSQDGHGAAVGDAGSLEQLLKSIPSTTNNTVNPASLSPALTPIPEAAEEQTQSATAPARVADAATTPTAKASPDATQHPAAMLCPDLQCRSAEAPPSAWLAASQQRPHPALALLLPFQLLLAATSAMVSVCQRPLTQIALSLRAGFSLPPTRAILTTIIWLVTTPHPSRSRPDSTSSTSTSSSPTARFTSRLAASSSPSSPCTAAPSPTRPSSTLRLRTLRKILTCSPILARPLMDATMEVLRLVSSKGCSDDRVSGGEDAPAAATAAGGDSQRPLRGWPTRLPSKEALLTLLWVLQVEERRLQIRGQVDAPSEPGKLSVSMKAAPPVNGKTKTTTSFVLKVVPKRGLEEADGRVSYNKHDLKRRRFY
ncbi:hypothetical protein VTK56DRAFT_5251 [Thermocarpiscus australiensis]